MTAKALLLTRNWAIPLPRAVASLVILVAVSSTFVGFANGSSASQAAAPQTAQKARTGLPATVNDPRFDRQWGVSAAGAPYAWQLTMGGGATIAIIDSGVDLEHEDLAGRLSPGGNVSCLGTGGDATRCHAGDPADGRDTSGHGTHVAGVALATANNRRGGAGVAPRASLLSVKALSDECAPGGPSCGTADDVAAAIRYAADRGADVINLSLGERTETVTGPLVADALRYAWSRGAVPVVAAGNSVLSSGFTQERALVVAALNRHGQAATYSNGVGTARWSISAPGGEADTERTCSSRQPNDIVSTYVTARASHDEYYCLSGTSMAAPHVAGAVALLRSAGLSPRESVDLLLLTARDLGYEGTDATYGAGALDLRRAVARLVGSSRATPPSSTFPGSRGAIPRVSPDDRDPTRSMPDGSDPTSRSGSRGTTPTPTTAPSPNTDIAVKRTADRDPQGLSRWVLNLAVFLVVAVGAAHGWVFIQGEDWARRTPITLRVRRR